MGRIENTLDKELFEEVTGKRWLSDEEMDKMRTKMMGGGMEELDEEWMVNMVRTEYQLEQFDIVESVQELGATTTVVFVYVSKEDVDVTESENNNSIFEGLKATAGEIGKIARWIDAEKSLDFDDIYFRDINGDRKMRIAFWVY